MAYDVKKTDHLFVAFNRYGRALRDSKGNTKIYKDLKTLKQHNKEDDGKPSMSASDYYVDFMEYAPADKWIPVSERLPGQYKTVLVWTKHREMGEAQHDGKHFVWVDDDGCNDYAHATHWMPLPEPPKEDN